MYRPFGEWTAEMLEEKTYFAPGVNPEQIFRSNSRAGRSATKRMLIIGLIIDCTAILLLILASFIR